MLLIKTPQQRVTLTEKGVIWLTNPAWSPPPRETQGRNLQWLLTSIVKSREKRVHTNLDLSQLSLLTWSRLVFPQQLRQSRHCHRHSAGQPYPHYSSLRPLPRWLQTVSSWQLKMTITKAKSLYLDLLQQRQETICPRRMMGIPLSDILLIYGGCRYVTCWKGRVCVCVCVCMSPGQMCFSYASNPNSCSLSLPGSPVMLYGLECSPWTSRRLCCIRLTARRGQHRQHGSRAMEGCFSKLPCEWLWGNLPVLLPPGEEAETWPGNMLAHPNLVGCRARQRVWRKLFSCLVSDIPPPRLKSCHSCPVLLPMGKSDILQAALSVPCKIAGIQHGNGNVKSSHQGVSVDAKEGWTGTGSISTATDTRLSQLPSHRWPMHAMEVKVGR